MPPRSVNYNSRSNSTRRSPYAPAPDRTRPAAPRPDSTRRSPSAPRTNPNRPPSSDTRTNSPPRTNAHRSPSGDTRPDAPRPTPSRPPGPPGSRPNQGITRNQFPIRWPDDPPINDANRPNNEPEPDRRNTRPPNHTLRAGPIQEAWVNSDTNARSNIVNDPNRSLWIESNDFYNIQNNSSGNSHSTGAIGAIDPVVGNNSDVRDHIQSSTQNPTTTNIQISNRSTGSTNMERILTPENGINNILAIITKKKKEQKKKKKASN